MQIFQYPNKDWTGEAKFVIDDNSDLSKKINEFISKNMEFKIVEKNDSIDIIEIETEPVTYMAVARSVITYYFIKITREDYENE